MPMPLLALFKGMRPLRAASLLAVAGFGLACGGPPPVAARSFSEAPLAVSARAVAQANETRAAVAADAASKAAIITVSAIGDCAIGDLHHGAGAPGSFAAELAGASDPMGYPFASVRSVFLADDLTIANLEGTLTDHKAWQNPVFSIRGKPAYATILQRGGVDVVDIDNNHSGDYGAIGIRDTRAALESAQIGYFGRGHADRRTIKGIEIVNLGYLGGPSSTKKRMVADVRRFKGVGKIVIVSFHWGVEAFYATHPGQVSLGRAAIDAGADLVLGHHPHVLQGIETYRGRHIVYSLGNFVFGANSQPKDTDSIIYQERFSMREGRVASVDSKIIAVAISSDPIRNNFQPFMLAGSEAARVVAKVERLSKALPQR